MTVLRVVFSVTPEQCACYPSVTETEHSDGWMSCSMASSHWNIAGKAPRPQQGRGVSPGGHTEVRNAGLKVRLGQVRLCFKVSHLQAM